MEIFIAVFGYLVVAAIVVIVVMVIADDRSAEAQAGAALVAIIWPVAVPIAILLWMFTRLAYGVQKHIDKRKINHP